MLARPNLPVHTLYATDQSGGPEHAPGTFDWFPSHGDKDPVISALEDAGVAKTGRILDIGCGNSQVCFKLREAGFTRVAGVDFSDVVISNMRRQTDSGSALQDGHTQHFFTMDATNLSFSDESFDAVTDKGLLDSICFEHDHWYSYQKACRRGQEPAPSVQVAVSTYDLLRRLWQPVSYSKTRPHAGTN
jgi:SAM-dependent methyltransferase